MIDLSKLNRCDTPYKIHSLMFRNIVFVVCCRVSSSIYFSRANDKSYLENIDEAYAREIFDAQKEFGDNLMALGRS